MNWRATLKSNALSIAVGSFAIGVASGGASLVGFFDNQTRYCDPITNPCTTVTIPDWFGDPPPDAKFVRLFSGNKVSRIFWGILSPTAFAVCVAAALVAVENQRVIDERLSAQEFLEAIQKQLLSDEEIQKLAIASEMRVQDFRRELLDGYAALLLDKHPLLMEKIASKPPQPTEIPPVQQESNQEDSPEEVSSAVESPSPKKKSAEEPETHSVIEGVTLPIPPNIPGIVFFDWLKFKNNPEDFPHVRLVAPTNGGKTLIADWLLDVFPAHEKFVLTIKQKPHQWQGLPVFGVPEDYEAVHSKLEWLEGERIRRTANMAKGIEAEHLSVAVDEWRAIARNCKAEKDPETKQIIRKSAKEIMGEMITLAREPKIRIFALAQGRQVKTWGVEDESDILECFTSIFMGQFAVEEAESLRNKFAKDSVEFIAWNRVVEFLKSLGKRAGWVECELGKFPAIMPDLSKWKRQDVKEVDGKKNTEDIRTKLEFLLEQTPPQKRLISDSDSLEEKPFTLTSLQQRILEYLKGKSPRTTRQIKKSSDKFKDDSEPQIKEALEELISLNRVKFDADTGGYFTGDL
jgi:hypothetical protein